MQLIRRPLAKDTNLGVYQQSSFAYTSLCSATRMDTTYAFRSAKKKETFKGCSIHAGPVVGSKLFELVVYMATAESPRQNARRRRV